MRRSYVPPSKPSLESKALRPHGAPKGCPSRCSSLRFLRCTGLLRKSWWPAGFKPSQIARHQARHYNRLTLAQVAAARCVFRRCVFINPLAPYPVLLSRFCSVASAINLRLWRRVWPYKPAIFRRCIRVDSPRSFGQVGAPQHAFDDRCGETIIFVVALEDVMHGAGRNPVQFGLLPDTQATVCQENFPQLLDLACLPSLHRPQGVVVLCCRAHLHQL